MVSILETHIDLTFLFIKSFQIQTIHLQITHTIPHKCNVDFVIEGDLFICNAILSVSPRWYRLPLLICCYLLICFIISVEINRGCLCVAKLHVAQNHKSRLCIYRTTH